MALEAKAGRNFFDWQFEFVGTSVEENPPAAHLWLMGWLMTNHHLRRAPKSNVEVLYRDEKSSFSAFSTRLSNFPEQSLKIHIFLI